MIIKAIRRWFRRRHLLKILRQTKENESDGYVDKVVGVTLDWGGRAVTVNPQGKIFPYDYEMIRRKEYYPDGPGTWPKDPETGEKLPIYDP